MVLQRNNFTIPAQFTFQPYSTKWRMVEAETVDWANKPKLLMVAEYPDTSEMTWLRVQVQLPLEGISAMLAFGPPPSYTVLMNRTDIPPDALGAHENHGNTPDVSGRKFQVLVSREREGRSALEILPPGEVKKNAWLMRDEFLNLEPAPQSEWDWIVWFFLNKWGIWESGMGYWQDWQSSSLIPPFQSSAEPPRERPNFLLISPHLLKVEQEKYRSALLPSNARTWLHSHSLNLDPADESALFRVRRSYCKDAIEATITIDHLAKAKFALCKRCHKVFEKEKKYKMSYCSRSCASAASVERFREKQRKASKKGRKAQC